MSSPEFNFEVALYNYAGAIIALENAKAAIVTEAGNLQGSIGPLLAPTVTDSSPASGSTDGGTTVTITGTQLATATGVSFQDTTTNNVMQAASFTVVDDSTVTAATPAGTGTSWVLVQTPWGSNSDGDSDTVTFTWS